MRSAIRPKIQKLLLLLLMALIILDLGATAAVLRMYPQLILEPETLIGANQENLKDFALGDDGELISLSDDPWIQYVFAQPMNVRHIAARVSHVNEDTWAQFFLMPSADYRVARLDGEGTITADFSEAAGHRDVLAIRLDLANELGVSLAVDQVIVNDRLAVTLSVQAFFAKAAALAALVLLELWGWVRLWKGSRTGMGMPALLLTGALFQAAGKLAFIWTLRTELLTDSGDGYAHLLAWMLALGLEIFSVVAVHAGAAARDVSQSNRLPLRYCCLLVVPFAFAQFSLAELLNLVTFDFNTPSYFGFNLLICALLPALLLLLIRRVTIALGIAGALLFLLNIANHYYGILRDNPLEYFDIALARTAAGVLGNYEFEIDRTVMAALLAMLIIVAVLAAALGLRGCVWSRKEVVVALTLTAVATGFLLVNIPTIENFSNLQIISSEQGYLLSFASFIKMGRVERPQDYSPQAVDMILGAYVDEGVVREKEESAEEDTAKDVDGNTNGIGTPNITQNMTRTPNIIVIMDEAFADLPDIYGFETTEDVLPNIHSLKENTIHGRLLVSVYGGGTSNTEYEFLTGNSLHFLPVGSSPYVQYMSGLQQSLAWKLRALDYSSAAYHPYLAISYRRAEAYPLLGLEPFYSIDDDLPNETYLRDYISDQADFDNLIYLYEQKNSSQPFFIFNVTMQNHGGYAVGTPEGGMTELAAEIRPVPEDLQDAALLEYLALIHETDAAFQSLVDYFSEVPEDTIILLFGDHQPSMDPEVVARMSRSATFQNGISGETSEDVPPEINYYATFVLWANFDIEEAENVVTSPNYLRVLLAQRAGLELNAYERFLLETMEEYPAMNAFGCLDSDGQWHSRDEEDEGSLADYRNLVYNNIFDKKNMDISYYR
ncbi:MAG: LTA synthase family protein [Clostridiales bacterium]|nr:LTA synthase family protein [Clostridiales bacterium]